MDGNKLRDVLRKARAFIDCSPLKKIENDFGCIDRDEICAKIDSALAEPVKNCEVGTPEEQAQRMADFCKRHYKKAAPGRHICSACKFHNKDAEWECYFVWAQLPYEAKEGGAK